MAIKASEAAKIFDALSDENRIKLVNQLADGEKSATMLLAKMPFTQPTLSHHLSILCDAKVLNSRRNGKSVMYSINQETAAKAAQFFAGYSPAEVEIKETPAPKKAEPKVPAAKPKKAAEHKEEPKPQPVTRLVNDDFDFFD